MAESCKRCDGRGWVELWTKAHEEYYRPMRMDEEYDVMFKPAPLSAAPCPVCQREKRTAFNEFWGYEEAP